MTYEKFRTGLTFQYVAAILKEEQRQAYEAGRYFFWGRRTVLGRWHQYKLEMWRAYLEDAEAA